MKNFIRILSITILFLNSAKLMADDSVEQKAQENWKSYFGADYQWKAASDGTGLNPALRWCETLKNDLRLLSTADLSISPRCWDTSTWRKWQAKLSTEFLVNLKPDDEKDAKIVRKGESKVVFLKETDCTERADLLNKLGHEGNGVTVWSRCEKAYDFKNLSLWELRADFQFRR